MREPRNEQGLIVYFSANIHRTKWEIVSIRTRFLDAILKNLTDEQEWRVEFEFRASSFIRHGHSFRDCDLIICWVNDLPESPIPVLALSEPDWFDREIVKTEEYQTATDYWMARALKAERELEVYQQQSLKAVKKVIDCDRSVDTTPDIIAAIRNRIQVEGKITLTEVDRIGKAIRGHGFNRSDARKLIEKAGT